MAHHQPVRSVLFYLYVCTALLLQSCQPAPRIEIPTAQPANAPTLVDVQVEQTALASPAQCESSFAVQNLLFATGTRLREIRTYDSNGSGLAVGDLDDDGLLDIVFASIDGQSAIFWNEGGMKFREEVLDDRYTRAAAVVDVDGDGQLDIVFSHRSLGGVSYWRNQGTQTEPRFKQQALTGVDHYAYALAWGDLNGDGALDLVTGAYDAELKMRGLSDEEIQAKGGVVLYEQREGSFTSRALTGRAEALTIALLDLDGDMRSDIWVANDFALGDGIWQNLNGAWKPAAPFQQTSHSTMSIEWADIDNDGATEIFTTDMNPGDLSPEILAAWLPVIKSLEEKHGPQDPQIMANVLQVPAGAGRWRNDAPRSGIDATGWSWSGKFGDLNNDGLLDLYIVNGMIAANLFAHLNNGELVESNRAFQGSGGDTFAPADHWGLGSTASGRGMVMADLNNDGRLDIVVSNLRSQAQLFENRLCEGTAVEVELRGPASLNSRALGARLAMHTDRGIFTREVRAESGYLSGEPPRVHFGVPRGAEIQELVITYPDGAEAHVAQIKTQTLVKVVR
jgi:hypothetical protein